MAKYVVLIDFTEQGMQNFKDTTSRAQQFIETAKQAGVAVKEMLWTSGSHDGLLLLDAKDDATVSALMLSLAQLGNVRTETLRAYDREEIASVISKMA